MRMSKKILVILGAGGYGQSVCDIARQLGRYSSIIFLDDNPASSSASGRLEQFADYINDEVEFYPAFGNNNCRKEWIDKLAASGCRLATIVHQSAYVSPMASLGEAVVVMPHACIGTEVKVSDGCIINLGAIVDHGCLLEECVHLAPGAVVKAENRISALSKIDSGRVVENREYPLNG